MTRTATAMQRHRDAGDEEADRRADHVERPAWRPSGGGARVAAAVERAARAVSSRRSPPAALRRNQRMPSADLDRACGAGGGGRRPARWHGCRRRWPSGTAAAPRPRRPATRAAPSGRRSGRTRRRGARRAGSIDGRARRPRSAPSARSSRAWVWVWDPMVASPEADQLAQPGPGDGRAVAGEGDAALDEVGGHVERRRRLVADEHRERLVDPVGGAVVEGEHDGLVARRSPAASRSSPSSSDTSRPASASSATCSSKRAGGQVDLRRRAAADPVVDEDHEARRVGTQDVGAGGGDLHGPADPPLHAPPWLPRR